MLAKHRRRALVHAVPWSSRAESNRRSTGFVIRRLSAWLRGHDTASCRARRPTTAPAIARLAVNARSVDIVVGTDGVEPPSSGLQPDAAPFQLHSRGVGVSRTRSSPSRLIDVANRRLTVRPPLRMRSRRVPSRTEDAAYSDRWSARGGSTSGGVFGHTAQEPHATLERFAVFKGRAEPDVHDRARNEHGVAGESRTRLRLAPQASASTTLASTTMAGPGRIERPSRGLESRLSPTTRARKKRRGDRLRADPLVIRMGVSEQELWCSDTLDRARTGRPERIFAQAIQIHVPRLVASGPKSIGCA